MKYRPFGNTGLQVSEISLGTWQVGGKWGSKFDDKLAEEILHGAIDAGVNFIDTADVYSEGLSEKAVSRVVKERSEEIFIATKAGRRLNPHTPSAYTPEAITSFVEDSLKNMGLETLDLVQLHCPPTEVYEREEMFDLLRKLKKEGKIRFFGVSVEKVSEAVSALQYPDLSSIQIIFNMFRHKPAEDLFPLLGDKRVGILARVPLASGLLSGKMSKATTFEKGDHRFFNRNGEAFDKGETFSGVDFEKGLEAVEKLKDIFGEVPLYQIALKWILSFPEVSCVIPGASKTSQVGSNMAAVDLPDLSQEELQAVKLIYDQYFREHIHQLW
ncbi:MAG: aldo/keto reductase [Bacteroidota bacterium]